jgi:hypothetical protein
VSIPLETLRTRGDAQPLPHDDCYWVWPGHLLAGAYPAPHVDLLLAAGVDAFIDLTQAPQPIARYAAALAGRARWHGFAITDYAVPGRALMRDIVDTLDAELARGARVYLHCHAGVGRTGTAVGCWLVEHGVAPIDALALIAHKRAHLRRLGLSPQSPETEAQRAFVRQWSGAAGA